ncbi:MAG TPA: DUF1501 domain-containing protein, partial [Planctomycetaceae bacterium]|nr:DUF1501 domain-containing protein [Planctomycetaceae bacterium]
MWNNRGSAQVSRRHTLSSMCLGFGGLAFQSLLAQEASSVQGPLAAQQPHFAARAKRVIFLFMHGGPSHVDTFDPKP